MNASQDKVQGILETVLEESIPLVNKGVFSPEQMRQIMMQREKHENKMLSSSYQLSDYLSAIEYQYSLERLRRYHIDIQSSNNPLLKKQSKTDFIIIKRIIKLWDRTLHKFKYNVALWKQYLAFCITIDSRKHFYKALAASLRFLPFSDELWKIGIQYETQKGLNLWKARKLFIKALKMNPQKLSLYLEMFKFQIYFAKTLQIRQNIICKGEEKQMEFLLPQQMGQQIEGQQIEKQSDDQGFSDKEKIQNHDIILQTVICEAIKKCSSSTKELCIYEKFENVLRAYQKDKQYRIVKPICQKINQYILEEKKSLLSILKVQKYSPRNMVIEKKVENFNKHLQIIQNWSRFDSQLAQKIINQYLNKSERLTQILQNLLNVNPEEMMRYCCGKFKNISLPSSFIISILELNKEIRNPFSQPISRWIKKISINSYKQNLKALEAVIKFYKQTNNMKQNNRLYRSIKVHCQTQPQIIQRCSHWMKNQ